MQIFIPNCFGMKKIYFLLFTTIMCLPKDSFSQNQNVGIGTTTPVEKLEVKNALRSTLKISSNSFNDTTQLLLSNRAGTAGTDFSLKSIQELGLFFSSLSDLPQNNSSNSLVITPGGNVGVGIVPNSKFHVNGNMMLQGVNLFEFGAGVAGKETNAGKIGYNGFGTNALAIVGAGTNTSNRAVYFFAEGGTIMNGPLDIGGPLKVNGNSGTAGQVLTSNGTSNPSWQNTAYSNTTRFSATGTDAATVFSNLNFSTDYNTNPTDVTIGASSITINRTGLYHFEGHVNIRADYFPSAAYSPYFYMYFNMNSGGYLDVLMNDLMFRDGSVTGSEQRYFFNRPFSLELYVTSGSVIVLSPAIYPNAVTGFIYDYTVNFRGNLISE
jgi:hypothetical protein